MYFHIGFKNQKLVNLAIEAIKESNKAKQQWHDRELGRLKKEHKDIQTRLDRMLDLLADGIIDKDEFRAKKESAKQRQHEITELIQAYDGAEDAFFNTMEKLLKLVTNAHSAFAGSKIWLKLKNCSTKQ